MKRIIEYIAIITLLLSGAIGVSAQEKEKKAQVSGRVTDRNGEPLAGIRVSAGQGGAMTVTGMDGAYVLTLPEAADELRFAFPGYRTAVSPVTDGKADVVLDIAETFDRDETVYLGHTTLRKGEISGAVSSVSGRELAKSPVSNLSMALAGRLPGLFTQETYSEPSRANTGLYVRGVSSIRGNQPVVVIDGMVVSHNTIESFDYISANEIESVSLLKDAASLALYGIQGADGVLVITTRRGQQGKLKIGVSLDQTFEQRTTTPDFISSGEYARMRNQAAFNDGLGKNHFYSDEQVAAFESGSDREHYPNNNWREMFLKDLSSMQRLGIDLSGGSDRVLHYSNVNLLHQGNFYNTDQSDYNAKNRDIWVNFRSNVDVKINKYLSSSLRLAGNVKREKTPGGGFLSAIYPTLFHIPPTVYGPTTPDGGVIVTDKVQGTPYGLINRSGFTRHTVTNVYAQFALNLDLGFLTKGLSLNGSFAYQTNAVNTLNTPQTYEKWIRTGDLSDLAFGVYGSDVNSPLRYEKSSSMYYQLTYQGMLNYNRTFGKHRVGAMAYVFYQDLSKGETTMPLLLPYMKLVSGAEATYNYDDRYLLKFDIGYSGSEQYAPSHRFVATPAFSAAWVLSNEPFMRDVKWLSDLRFRVSYGKTATDRSGLGRYAYLDNITLTQGGTIPSLSYIVTESQVGNPDIAAEISKKLNVGVDIGLFDNLTLSVDYFKDRMDNMVISSSASLPTYQGVPMAALPMVNTGVFENKGYEIGLNFSRQIGRDWSLSLGGSLLYAENKIINGGEVLKDADYAYRNWSDGYPYGQEFGYLVNRDNGNGFYNSAEEIAADGLTYEIAPRVGDLRYMDLNHDGIINEKDKAPIGSGAVPKYYYSFYGELKWKSFDLSILFQGIGKYSTTFSGAGVYEYDLDGVFGSLHRNAWTQERYDSGQRIDYPALSTQKNSNHETNSFFLYNRSYLRLKNVEIGYTLPAKWARAISAENLRISVSGQNLLTWDKMKSGDFGPEGTGYLSVPVYRLYNIRLSMNF